MGMGGNKMGEVGGYCSLNAQAIEETLATTIPKNQGRYEPE